MVESELLTDLTEDTSPSGEDKIYVGKANDTDVFAKLKNLPTPDGVTALLAEKQTLDADLTSIAELTPSNDDIIQRKSDSWTNRTMSQLKTDLALNNVDNTSDANKPISTATQAALDKTRRVIKSADESRTSSGSFLDDSELTLSVEANRKYYIKLIVISTSVNNAGRIKYRLSGPASATSKTSNSALNAQTANAINELLGSSGWTHSSGDATERQTSIEGVIIISNTAGS